MAKQHQSETDEAKISQGVSDLASDIVNNSWNEQRISEEIQKLVDTAAEQAAGNLSRWSKPIMNWPD